VPKKEQRAGYYYCIVILLGMLKRGMGYRREEGLPCHPKGAERRTWLGRGGHISRLRTAA
jgi:hypothetical protein